MTVDRTLRNHLVYRMYDETGSLLYVGCTMDPHSRWGAHNTSRPHMTRRAVRFRVQGPYTYDVARSIEREALRTEFPEFGWTPQKRRDKRLRDKWIDVRTEELMAAGREFWPASRQAWAEADEQWPDPVAGEYGPPRLRVAS